MFHDPPVKCSITGHGANEQLEVVPDPPPTVHTSPLDTMNTEFRSFNVPIATPFVHAKPFQWIIVGSVTSGSGVRDEVERPTAQPSFGFAVPLRGGPKEIEFKVVNEGLVSVPQFTPS